MGLRIEHLEGELEALKAADAAELKIRLEAAEEVAAARVAGAEQEADSWKQLAGAADSWVRSPYLWFAVGALAAAAVFAVSAYALRAARWVGLQ